MKMLLPSIDRTPNLRPTGADVASSGANRVIPVAPVNSPVHASPPLVVESGVVDMVNPALKSNQGAAVYTHTAESNAPPREDLTAPRDWTIHRPEPKKEELPPPKPMSQLLMEHIRSMWNASASAVQVEQVSDQLSTPAPQALDLNQASAAQQMLVYTPSKVRKTEDV